MNPNTDLITVLESTTARLYRETVDRLGAREMLINELAPFIYPQMHRYDGKLAEAAIRDRQLLIKSQAIADLASSLYASGGNKEAIDSTITDFAKTLTLGFAQA